MITELWLFLFNTVQIKQHSDTVSWGAWWPAKRDFSPLILSERLKGSFWFITVLFYLWPTMVALEFSWRKLFVDDQKDKPTLPGCCTFLQSWILCLDLNMIFISHDNSDGGDDTAFYVVMLMQVPGITGCKETLVWCPPCWLWTLFCPRCLSDWLMSADWKAVSVFHFVLLLTCFCQSVCLI